MAAVLITALLVGTSPSQAHEQTQEKIEPITLETLVLGEQRDEPVKIEIGESRYQQAQREAREAAEKQRLEAEARARAERDARQRAASTEGDGVLGSLSNREIVRRKTIEAWGEHEWSAMEKLVQQESGFRNTAQNPTSTAYGMYQFLNATWRGVGCQKTSDPVIQTDCGIRYIKASYGTPSRAWAFHRANNWY